MKKSNKDEDDLKAHSAAQSRNWPSPDQPDGVMGEEETTEQTESIRDGVEEAVISMCAKNRKRDGGAAAATSGPKWHLQGLKDPVDGSLVRPVDEDEENHSSKEQSQTVEIYPDAKPAPFYRTRRFHVRALLVLLVIAAIATGVTTVGIIVGRNENVPTRTAPKAFREDLGIQAKIEDVVGSELLEDPNSAYSKALDWIIHDDPMQLPPDSPNLVQRYIASYFYIATSVNGPWLSCNPPKNPWSDFTLCYFLDKWDEVIPHQWHEVSANRWLSNITECVWAGVRCNENGQISEIDVKGNELSGRFPEGVYHLPMLQNVSLSWGTMSGPLPAKLGEMKQLRRIELSQHAFTGSIPDEWWQLTNLHKLLIGANKLTGTISPEIANLKDVDELAFFGNKLSGTIPQEMGSLENMKYLDLSQNQLEGPLRIGSWEKMRWLWLNRNRITGTIPPSIGKMSELNWLRLHQTQMKGELPDELYSLSVLAHLDLYECNFYGAISSSIGKFANYLRDLRISSNRFNGTLPSEMSKLTRLETVWLHDNGFTGTIPQELCAVKYGPILSDVSADCAANGNKTAELTCPRGCCTKCCEAGGTRCFAT